MPNKVLSLLVSFVLLVSLASVVLASEATGSLETGIQSGMQGVVKAAPTVSPVAGEYHATQTVTLTASGSTKICYTVDGTTPACATPTTCTTGTALASGGTLSVTLTKTVKSRACYADSTSSDVTSTAYTLTCSTSSVANGSVSAYPSCTITCDSGYVLSGSTCQASGGGGGGGGGGVGVAPPMPTTTTGTVTATADGGGKTTLTTTSGTVSVTVPINAVTSSTTIIITSLGSVESQTGNPPAGSFLIGGYVYNISALASGQPVTNFSKAVTIAFTYSDTQIAGLNESALTIYHWTGTQWTPLPSTVYASENTVMATTTSFSKFALLGTKGAAPITTVAGGLTRDQILAQIAQIQALIIQLTAQLQQLTGGTVTTAKFNTDLSYGMKGAEVKRMQEFLVSKGYLKAGLNTGNYLSATSAAVKAYQVAKGIAGANGRFGPATRAAANKDLGF